MTLDMTLDIANRAGVTLRVPTACASVMQESVGTPSS